MNSAFGIDHGYDEVSKLGFAGLGSKIAGKTMSVGQGMRRSGAANIASGKAMGSGSSYGQGMQRGGAARVAMGGKLKQLGAGMAKHPTATGGVAAGGGAAVLGAGASSYARRNRGY